LTREIDFSKQNAEVKKVWEDYRAGRPARVPVMFGINPRYLLLDPKLNPAGITFEQYSADPQLMLEAQLRFHEWVRFNVPHDAPMGLPDAWDVYVDFQNYYEAGFLGAQIYFPADNVPVARPFLDDDNKRMLLDNGMFDLDASPLWRKNVEFYEHFVEKKKEGFTHKGRPIGNVSLKGLGTDGPLTLFMSTRGDHGLLDMYVDPDYFHQMMAYFTDFAIGMVRKARRIAGQAEKQDALGLADDSIELLSAADYGRFILPYHRRLKEELGGSGPYSIHICGDVQRHFPALVRELGITSIDTGFPIRWETLRDEVGDSVEISGGPHVEILRRGTPAEIRTEVRRILASGIMRGGRFILREGNNLAPLTPLANLRAMYEAAGEFGRY